jgi:hypothetical protein
LIDIGFFTVGFSKEFGSISYWTVLDWIGFGSWLFPDNWILYINQLLVQKYIASSLCAMAYSPFLLAMVFTATIVKDRIIV